MQVHVLASGSTGNAVCFQLGKAKILVDAGISTKRIEYGLAQIGIKAGELDGVLITHEHTDHIRGLDVLIRKYQLPVYTRPRTWDKIKCKDNFSPRCRIEIGKNFTIGNIDIEAFNIPHDAADPVGFGFYYRHRKWVIATDLGEVTMAIKQAVSHSDLLVLESNHDAEMLSNGPYPRFLKQRIKSKLGHLSNTDAAGLICSLPLQNRQTHVFLAHLSRTNNFPELAEKTVMDILEENSIDDRIVLHRTHPNKTSSYKT